MKSILVVHNSKSKAEQIRKNIPKTYKVDVVTDLERVLTVFTKNGPEIVFIDVGFLKQLGKNSPDIPYKEGLERFLDVYPSTQIVVTSSHDGLQESMEAARSGAHNYITYPIDADELNYIISNLKDSMRMQSELNFLRSQYITGESFEVFHSVAPVMKKIMNKIRSVAPTRSTVLLTGETGTGKGVMARLIHRCSSRSDTQFISVHCGAISDNLLESELFGHEKGAFTGAVKRKMGKFEVAHGGTIFLDEIGAISTSMQIKLLKVLQDRTFERVGGEESITVDVRIIAATNEDLKKMSDEGKFRRDLYYRLNVFPVEIPPLRERKEDIPLLVEAFLKRMNRLYFKSINEVGESALTALENYEWPGNIRELENLVERAYILENSDVLTYDNFPLEMFSGEVIHPRGFIDLNLPLEEVRRQAIEFTEKQYLKKLLALKKGKIKDTAQVAGVGVRQLHKLLTKYEIKKEEFKNR